MNIIRELNERRGVTVVMVSHDLNLASEYCDRLLMLHKGVVANHGTPDEVLTEENIESVYGVKVRMERNPVSGRPHVMLISGDGRKLFDNPTEEAQPRRTTDKG